MKIKKNFVVALFLCFCFLSNVQPSFSQKRANTSDPDNLAKEYFSQIMGVAVKATTSTKLYQFVYEWLGTPYRLGGNSKNGIDCSKFSLAVYQQVFDTTIGYNSRNQSATVVPIEKSNLQAGDLVFFKIRSRNVTHVGVYLGDNRFAHASTSKGVMISDLDEAYWKRYYYQGGRPPHKDDLRMMTADAGTNAQDENNLL